MAILRAVLLDIDGTLVDSNDAHAQAWVDALAQFGHCVAFERMRCLIGMGADKLLAKAAGIDRHSTLGQRLEALRSELFEREHLPRLKAFPGAQELLGRLHEAGHALVAATSAKTREVDALLDICGARELVQLRASSDDADRSKPDPDIVRAALARARVAPEAALMLGDTPYDIEAASRSGVRSVALRCGGWGDWALHGALAIYDDTADLLARIEQSPFVARAALAEPRAAPDPATEDVRRA